jgi:exonuclease VII small subunit
MMMALDYEKAKENLTAHVAKITEQRNELLEALKDLVGATTHLQPCPATLERALAAIAKAEQ